MSQHNSWAFRWSFNQNLDFLSGLDHYLIGSRSHQRLNRVNEKRLRPRLVAAIRIFGVEGEDSEFWQRWVGKVRHFKGFRSAPIDEQDVFFPKNMNHAIIIRKETYRIETLLFEMLEKQWNLKDAVAAHRRLLLFSCSNFEMSSAPPFWHILLPYFFKEEHIKKLTNKHYISSTKYQHIKWIKYEQIIDITVSSTTKR